MNPQLAIGTYSGIYGTTVPLGFLESGAALITGDGGSDVGPVSVTVAVPPPFSWTNVDSVLAIPRDQPLTLTWTGGDPAGYVQIAGLCYTTQSTGAEFYCYAPTSAGQFTIPARLLSMLPASSDVPGGSVISLASYSLPGSFQMPGIDLGISSADAVAVKMPVTYQ